MGIVKFQTCLKNFRGAAQVGAAFRAPDDHRLGRGGTNDTKCVDCIDLDGDEHMDMIVQHMNNVGYNKYHKPNPTGELEVKVNMFIDTIQGNVSEIANS